MARPALETGVTRTYPPGSLAVLPMRAIAGGSGSARISGNVCGAFPSVPAGGFSAFPATGTTGAHGSLHRWDCGAILPEASPKFRRAENEMDYLFQEDGMPWIGNRCEGCR